MNNCVKLEWVNTATALVTMQDIASQNTLSRNLTEGLQASFSEINKNPNVKVVVLTGLETNFCVSGESNSNDVNLSRLILECEIPIIAAAHGNALGDGLTIAAFAEILILAEDSAYSATTNSHANYIIPKKFGVLLGNELLYTSKKFAGLTLKNRNIPLKIVKKQEVIPTALELAKDFYEKPQISLRLLKRNFAQIIQNEMSITQGE